MDSNKKAISLNITPSSAGAVSSLPTGNIISAESATDQPLASASSLIKKHVIRKIIPLDHKILQQAGLDRKIAEALSEQKSQRITNQPGQNFGGPLPSHFPQKQIADAKNSESAVPAKYIEDKKDINKLKPPRITITGPEALTEVEKQNLANLNSQQRLVHVKNLLSKKILEKKSKEMNDNLTTNKLLKTPQPIGDRTQPKLLTKVATQKPATKGLFVVLKESTVQSPPSELKLQTIIKTPNDNSSIRLIKPTKATQKPAQEITGKLVFQTDTVTQQSPKDTSSNVRSKQTATEDMANISRSDDVGFVNYLSKGDDVIPKASIVPVNTQQQYKKLKQYTRKPKQVVEDSSTKNSLALTNKLKETQQQKIVNDPKPSATAIITQTKLTKKLDFPEVSLLKESFPTANVPKAATLPAIDSFKKATIQTNIAAQRNLQQNSPPVGYKITNYETSLFNQQSASSHANVNLNKATAPTNSLVVLENKILSQDEMIDLTELRLSSNTPRFIYPHRPIPEVVIKQEHPDDYQSTDNATIAKSFTKAMPENSKQLEIGKSVISNKQKKIIINAQKLKLPPEQLADLARRIKCKTTVKKTHSKVTKQVVHSPHGTKASNKILPIKNAPTTIVKPQEFTLSFKQTYRNIGNQVHDHCDEQEYSLPRQINFDSITTPHTESNLQSSSVGQKLYVYYNAPQAETPNLDMSIKSLGSQNCTQTAVEIVDEVVEPEDSFSAVDFIAALGNTSAELSYEELNLNASCTFNQTTSTPVKVNAPPQNTISPLVQASANTNLPKGTIVIESSKGQETILTNESPDKHDIEKVKEKIKIYYELNKQKSAKPESPNKRHTSDTQTRFCSDSFLYDNTKVYDRNIEELSTDQRLYVSEKRTDPLTCTTDRKMRINYTQQSTEVDCPIKREDLGKTSLITTIPANSSTTEKIRTALKPSSKPSPTMDYVETSTAIFSNVCESSVNLKDQARNLDTQIEADCSAKKTSEQMLEKVSQQKISKKTAETIQLPSKTGITKINETVANTTISSKRISKFKKGKINLVSRNKPLIGDKRNADEKDVTNDKDGKMRDEKKTLHEENTVSKIYDDKGPKGEAEEIPGEKSTACNQLTIEQSQNKHIEIGQHTVEGNKEAISKSITYCDKQKQEAMESEDIGNGKQQNKRPKTEISSQDLNTGKLQNVPIVLNSESAEETLQERVPFKDTIAPKDSINTSPSTSANPLKELASKATLVSNEGVESLAKEAAGMSETVIVSEKCDEKAKIRKVESEPENSAEKKLDVSQPTSTLETMQQSTTKVADKKEDKIVKISKLAIKSTSESAKLGSKEGNNQISPKSKLDANLVKEQNFESMTSSSLQSLPKELTGAMEKLQESKTDSANYTCIESSDSKTDTQCDKSLSVTKFKETEQNKFGLPKAMTGRMKVIQEHTKKHNVSDNLKIRDEVSDIKKTSNEEQTKHVTILKDLRPEREDDANDMETSQHETAVTKTTSNSSNPKYLQNNDEKRLKSPKIEKTEIAKSFEQNSGTVENLNPHSQAVLQTMKSAKVALIDIVKRFPIEQTNKPPILPFKKSSSATKCNVNDGLDELKTGGGERCEQTETLPEDKKAVKETNKVLAKNEEQSTSKCSRISSPRASKVLTPALPPKITRKRASFRPLISDDDLEFLPENAEIEFNLTKSRLKEENKKSNMETRQQSQYSSNIKKRSRYYSQTLETNVTITFDNLKTTTDRKESCQDSTQDSSISMPIKQRKKLRKTVEDIQKSQKILSDTDSDDSQNHYESLTRDCEESNEFLGFEDSPETNSSFDNVRYNVSDSDRESRNKRYGLRNWLSTGKAISPTPSRQRLQHKNVSPVAATSLSSTVIPQQRINVKKHWDLCYKNTYEETDITDDTSPACDDEVISEQIPLQKKLKRGIKNMIDSNKNTIDSKKLKLSEHSFKPSAEFSSKEKAAELKVSTRGQLSQGKYSGNTATASDCITSIYKDINSVDKTPNSAEPQKSKRGRKSKANRIAQQETTKQKMTKNNDENSADLTLFPHNKKRNLRDIEDLDSNSLLTPLKMSNANESDSDSLLTPLYATAEADSSMNDSTAKGKCVRQRTNNNESNFNSRILLVTKREQLESDEILTETSPGSGPIQCALCLTRTQPLQWTSHLAQHYGVGWKVGEEKLNIENRAVVLSTILNYMKNSKCAGLACRMCSKVLRSALGILTHIEQCGNQERVDCKFCKKSYAKNSLISHLRICKVRYASETRMNASETQSENVDAAEEIVGNLGRLKRHSTIKAENKLKVMGNELDNFVDPEKPEINPKSHIKYVPNMQLNFTEKWSKEIKDVGSASCPKARCKFTGTNINQLTEHTKKCKHMKTGYICNFCRKAFKTEKEAIDHITANHQKGRKRRISDDSDCGVQSDIEPSSDEGDLSEGVDENESEGNASDHDDLVDKTPTKKGNFSKTVNNRSSIIESRKGVFNGRSRDLNKDVLKKWCSFIDSNHSCDPLYTEFVPQYSVLNYLDYKKYMPPQTVSMKFNFSTKTKLIEKVGQPEDIKWSELKRFETINNNTHTYFFLGAPIKFCSWLPLPDDVNEQFLAVVYRQEICKYIKFNQPKQHRSIVLLFKVTQSKTTPELSLHYGFVINDGPIHHLSFLPSGGYDKSTNRLGLMATATVTSCIKVYSLPINVDLPATPGSSKNSNAAENIILIDIKPSFQLSLNVAHQNDGDEQQQEWLLNSQCLQICWSEFSGHHHIFAGFSNGFVGVWNIKNNSQKDLNCFAIDDVVTYVPLNYFFLGEKSIKCLALHYDTLGPRWLAASTAYRKLIVFDIKNLMNPIVYKEDALKNIMLCLDWCPIWEPFLISYDDALPNTGNGVIVVNPANIVFQHYKLDGAPTAISQVQYTPVANMCVTALNDGEIAFLDTRELHFDTGLSRKPFDRRAFYALDLKKLDGQPLVRIPKGTKQNDNVEIPSDWTMQDTNYKEKYGLVFTPLLKLDDKFRKAYMSENRTPPQNVIPFMRVNTLRCNINQKGKHLVAAGYENGFLRLIYFDKRKVFTY